MRDWYRRFREKILSQVRFNVLSLNKTFEWMESGKSIVRFGDGELSIILGGRGPGFQSYSKELSKDLRTVFFSDNKNLLKCLPVTINAYSVDLVDHNEGTVNWWRKWLRDHFWRMLYLHSKANREYGDTNVTRQYMRRLGCNSSAEQLAAYFSRVRNLFTGRDLIVVEGRKTRFGIGNDLFSNAKSVRRVLVPEVDAYSKKDEILNFLANTMEGSSTYVLACGPLAKILALRLAAGGELVWDLGHLDIEYEWYLRGAQDKIPIPGKYVNESSVHYVDPVDTDPTLHQKYRTQIIFEVPVE